jgi:hypothetical protein
MSRHGVQILRQLMTECKDVFRLNLGADPPANVKSLVIKVQDGAEPVRMSARAYAPPQLMLMRDEIRELDEVGLRTPEKKGRVPRSSFRSLSPTSIA